MQVRALAWDLADSKPSIDVSKAAAAAVTDRDVEEGVEEIFT